VYYLPHHTTTCYFFYAMVQSSLLRGVTSYFLLLLLLLLPLSLVCHAQITAFNQYPGIQCTGKLFLESYSYPVCIPENLNTPSTSDSYSCNGTSLITTHCSDSTCSSSCHTSLTPNYGNCMVSDTGLSSSTTLCTSTDPVTQSHYGTMQLTFYTYPGCSGSITGLEYIHLNICMPGSNGSGSYYACTDGHNMHSYTCIDSACKTGCNASSIEQGCDGAEVYYTCIPPLSSTSTTTSSTSHATAPSTTSSTASSTIIPSLLISIILSLSFHYIDMH
jgi:hypothetical protein